MNQYKHIKHQKMYLKNTKFFERHLNLNITAIRCFYHHFFWQLILTEVFFVKRCQR